MSMRCLVYNWRVVLGGVASASVLAVGIAAPTLPRSVSRADDQPTSALTGIVPSGSAARGVGCDLPGLPQAGPVVAALAGAPGTLCGSSATTTVPRRATSMLPGLSAVTSAIPGLSSLSGLGSVTGATSRVSGSQVGAGSLTGSLASASAVTGALSGLGGAFGGAQLGSQQP